MNGRRIPDPGFAGDDGSADPRLAAAQRAHAADDSRLPEVLAALHTARVLAPVVAVASSAATSGARHERRRSATDETEADTTNAGLQVEKTSDIALPLLVDAEGHRAVPVFSGLEALARWDPAARPVPVAGPRAAAVVEAEGAEALVLDVAGPCPVTLGPAEVRALAEGRAPVPAYDDEGLAGALAAVLADEPSVIAGWLGPGARVDALVTVALSPGVGAEEAGGRLATALGGLARRAVRGIDLAVQPASAPSPAGRLVYSRHPLP